MICTRYSTGATQETCPAIDHAGYTAPTRQHELDHTDQEFIYLSALKDLDHHKWEWMICR